MTLTSNELFPNRVLITLNLYNREIGRLFRQLRRLSAKLSLFGIFVMLQHLTGKVVNLCERHDNLKAPFLINCKRKIN